MAVIIDGTNGVTFPDSTVQAGVATAAEMKTGTSTTKAPSVASVRDGTGAGWGSFRATKGGANQTGIADTTVTPVTFGTEIYDIGSFFASNAWTPPAGKIHISLKMLVSATFSTAAPPAVMYIYKDGASWASVQAAYGGTGEFSLVISEDDIATGSNVYTAQVYIDVTAGTGTVSGTAALTSFSGHVIL